MRKQKKGVNKKGWGTHQEYISANNSNFCVLWGVSSLISNPKPGKPQLLNPQTEITPMRCHQAQIPNSYFNILSNTTGILVA